MRPCTYCGDPAVRHALAMPERWSVYLCAAHEADAEKFLAGRLEKLDEFTVVYEDDEDRAAWEPCEAVSYPDGFVSRAFPCDGWAEPGETECRECRNDAAAWRKLYDATCTTAD